ncbi:unnamed protein product [Candida verbasci]|uniref:Uncharacterized protein n=1 Tax=Candida verbasci TaxID=1227364 RepID=A0A9W4XF02_9ASCO|nr:unnamed protein product [Candida verbasci]
MSNAIQNRSFFQNIKPQQIIDKPVYGHTTSSSEIITIQINQTGSTIVLSRTDKSIRIWKTYPDRIGDTITIENAHGNNKTIESIAFNPKFDCQFATVAKDEYIKIWKGQNGQLENSIKTNSNGLKLIKYSNDGEICSCIDNEKQISFFNVSKNYKFIHKIQLEDYVYDLRWFNLNHDYFICGLHNGIIKLFKFEFELDKLILKKELLGHKSSITSIAINPRGSYFCCGSQEGSVSIWNTQEFLNLKNISDVDQSIANLDISRDGTYIGISYDKSSNIKLYDYQSSEVIFEIPNTSSGNMTYSIVKWFPNKTSLCYSSNHGTTLTVMLKTTVNHR